MKKYLLIGILLLICSLPALAQDRVEVTGLITDELDEPMIGVNIVVKDEPGLGTITDFEGKYKIKVNQYKTLIFSYIGYDKQEILVKDQKVINVKMIPSSGSVLDEVVVTGTGAQRKATVTGAISTVNLSELKKAGGAAATSITNALAGNVAGVIAMQTSGEPGKNTSEFWVRGISTFGASSGALVLVDGFERSLNEINVEDIESFSVLKDASATAIYGSKGANGVVLITTKRGKSGKININAKVEGSYNTRTRTPKFVDGLTYADMLNEARITRNLEPEYTPGELELLRNGLDPDLYPNVNWKDLLLKDGAFTQRATLDLNGGGSTARYFLSGSYIDEGGMYKTDSSLRKDYDTNANMKRWNYRMNVDIDITKTTLLRVGVSGSLEKQNKPGLSDDIWKSIVGTTPTSIPVMYSDGKVPAYGKGVYTNPWVLATQTGYRENWKNKIQTNITLEQKLDFLLEGLSFVGRFGYDTNNENENQRIKWPEQWKAERRRDENGNLIMNRISEEQLMKQSSESSGNRLENFEAELHYDRTFNQNHHVGGTFKYTQREETTTVNIGEDIMKGISKRNQGIAGRVTYNWNYRYFADFNFGYNGSENFAKGHRFGFFPAASVGWNLAEEKFIKKHAPWIEMLKLRYSYGEVGNDKISDNVRFPYLSSFGDAGGYDFGDFNSSWQFGGYHYTQVASNNLAWEVAKKHNLGLDLSLWNGKFTLTVDVYQDTREKIFMQRKFLPGMVGLWYNEERKNAPWANVGKMRSKGIDGNFMFKHKVGEVDFTLRGNMTFTKNEVLEYDEEQQYYSYKMTQGYRWNQARGLIALGLFKDYDDIRNSPKQTFGEYMPGDIKYKDVNGDGVINEYDEVPIGATTVPNMIYGVGLSAQWRGFDFNVHFQGAGKSSYMIKGPAVYAFSEGNWGNVLTDIAKPGNRWISSEISGDPATENPNAKYPRLSYGGNENNQKASTYWLRDGAYLRFKTLEIGYTLPKQFVNKLHIGDVRFYLLGNNLAVWDSLKLWDPEIGSDNGMAYPLSKSYTLGLTVNF